MTRSWLGCIGLLVLGGCAMPADPVEVGAESEAVTDGYPSGVDCVVTTTTPTGSEVCQACLPVEECPGTSSTTGDVTTTLDPYEPCDPAAERFEGLSESCVIAIADVRLSYQIRKFWRDIRIDGDGND